MNFYTNVALSGRNILLRGIENGQRIRRKVEYQPTFFLPSKKPTEFKTLTGEYVAPVQPGTIPDCREFVNKYKDVHNFAIYGNTRYKYAFIGDKYPGLIDWDVSKVLVAYLDIEVASDDGFPEPKDANKEITAITIKLGGKIHTFGCGEYNNTRSDVKYHKCADEYSLLSQFIDLWTLYCPDVVTGWNVNLFDITYIVNRIINLMGESEAKKLSPWNQVYARETTIQNRTFQVYDIVGVSVLDYLDLYKKYPMPKSQESWKLDHIAFIELNENKLDYSEHGSLFSLYKENFQKFIDYNIRDVELVAKLNDKGRLIDLALTLAYVAKVNYDDVFAQVTMWDAITYNHMLEKGIVVPQPKDKSKKEQYAGAYVKEPVPGAYDFVASFDLNSLYPHLIMQYNISMETLIQPEAYSLEMKAICQSDMTVDELLCKGVYTDFLVEQDVAMAANGQFFKRDKIGMMPEIMDLMYKDRTKYKDMAQNAKKKLQTVLGDDKQVEYIEKEISRYNNLQLAMKVTLNSAYGAMGNNYFRFFDLRIAEAITYSGQLSIRWIMNKVNQYMNSVLKTNKDYIVASDTDSIYIHLGPLINKVGITDKKKAIDFMNKVCEEKIQPYIDKSFQELAEYLNAYEQKMLMKRESLADKAIWTAKKNYLLNVWDDEGVIYKEPKIKIVGLAAVKSSTPSACRSKIREAIKIMIQQDEATMIKFIEQFRNEFKTLPLEEISFPRGVSGLAEYSDGSNIYKKGTPIHVKASLTHNHFIDAMGLTKKYQLIKEGEKIKFIYLKEPNPFRNNTLAFMNEMPKEFNADRYIDYDLQFETSFLKPLRTILDAIGWKTEQVNSIDDFFG